MSAATLPNFTILEFAFGKVDGRAEIVSSHDEVQGGIIRLTDCPGFGAELNLERFSTVLNR